MFLTLVLYTCINEGEAGGFILAPNSLDGQYPHRDIAYDHVPMVLIDGILGIHIAVIRSLVVLTSKLAKSDYWEAGLNLRKVRIKGFYEETLLRHNR